jgi:hypothetical protein
MPSPPTWPPTLQNRADPPDIRGAFRLPGGKSEAHFTVQVPLGQMLELLMAS